jgi:hypothetical protein
MQDQVIEISSKIASKVVLVCRWDMDEDNYDFSVRYYGTAAAPRSEQMAECLERAAIVAYPHIGIRLTDGNWIVGAVN